MRALLCGLLLTALAAAEPVPSYSFQGPKRPVKYRFTQRHPSTARTVVVPAQPGEWNYRPPQGQRAVPLQMVNWGGTVVEAELPGQATITSNGLLPAGSMVGIGRGNRFLGQARVNSTSNGSAQLTTLGNLQLQPGDWVNPVSIPAPPPQPTAYPRGFSGYHPTSTNADPTYQRWLRQGFTLGRIYRSSGFRRSYR